MKDGMQTYEFKFKFNAKDAKKQLKSISDDVLQMIHNMDTASNKMSVFTNLVGYLEKLDGALNQFKNDHKNDFANLFGDVDSQLAKSLESALGINPGKLAQLSGLRGRIDKALSDKAGVAETRKIAQDINELFTSIGRPEEINIDEWFTGTGKTASERIEKLNNALYKFYLQHQLLTNSIKNGFMSTGLNGVRGLSEEAQQEVQKLSDAYDELIDVKQKLQKAQSDIDKMRSKNNKKIVEEYKVELTEDSVGQLINEFDSLEKKISTGDKTSKNYYENLLKMTDVILKLNSALKMIRGDNALLTIFQGINVGGGYSHMFDKLSNYTSVKATQFESKFLDKTVEDGIKNLMSARRTQIEKILFKTTGSVGGGYGSGSGNGSGDGQVSLYKQLTDSLKEYTKAYKEYKDLEGSGADDGELGAKSDQIEDLKEKIFTLVDLSDEAYDKVDEILTAYEGKPTSFDQLIDDLTQVLGITKEINEEGSGKKLNTYEELLKIIDKLNAGLDIGDPNDDNIKNLIDDLKKLYATTEQLDDVDDILSNLIDGSIYDTDALKQLAQLFGVEIPNSVQTAAQKCEDFFNQVNRQKDIGLNDEFDAGQYLSRMERLKDELQSLRDQGRLTEDKFAQIQKTFDKDVKSYVDVIINKNNVLKELNQLNKDSLLIDDEASLTAIVQRRREIIALAEQNGTLLDKQLVEERAITDEIEKRIGMQKGGGKGTGSGKGGDGSGNGEGSGSGSEDASEESKQYEQLLEAIRLVEQAVKDKTAAFVDEKETVDEVVQQEIESLSRLSDVLNAIKETAQSLFGSKQGLVNTSVQEWRQALDAIYNTMQSISTMQSVDEMVARIAANADTIKNNLGDIGGGKEQYISSSGIAETVTKVDFTSLEVTIKSEIQSLVDKLDKTLKVEVVNSNTEEITSTINGIKQSIDKIVKNVNEYKAGIAGNKQQAQIDAMKNNLLQLKQLVSNFNARQVGGDYQQQEITGAIMSDGSISVGYGEKGEVPWDRVASSLVANLTRSLMVDLHSHPLKSFSNGRTYVNDAFSGSKGDLSAFKFSKQLGAKFAAEITGNIMRVLDLSKLSETEMMSLSSHVSSLEREYAKNPAYANYITHDGEKIKYKQQSTLHEQHKVTQILESIMYDAFKRMGYSHEKVDKEIFNKYDLTDDKQLTELASRLVQLSNASQAAIEPLERLKQIVALFDGNLGSSEAKTAFEAFSKGELSAADVFNQLNGKGHKISQETMDSLFRIDSANEIPAIESLLTQVTSILNIISTGITSIDGKIKLNTGKQFDYALNDIMEFSGLNDLGTEITRRITSSVESKFDPSNISEYKVKELSLNALNKAQDLIENFEYVKSKNGQIGVDMTQVMLDSFTSTLRSMEDAMSQEELYRERAGQRVLNDQGKRLEDDLVTTFYATFNKENIQMMRSLLARGKEKWQAQKDAYGDGADPKVDSISQNIDSLTSAVGELKDVVSGLQQYIASPQFTIKADTSVLEESMSSVSSEINTGAQKIADAVSEFNRQVNGSSEHGQVSINKHEMTMAMQEALYAREFASNYAKVEFHDVMDYDWRLDQYTNALTGELVGAFEEADKYFDKYFANFYKALDGSFVGEKEEAIKHLIQNLPKNDDFATVIVQAIQDQTGKIVNAIKVVLPGSISSNVSENGALINEEQIASAFKIVAQRASNWSKNNWSEPREFFNNVLSDSIYVDNELRNAFKTLGMLSSSGTPKFKVASEGLRNLGVAIGEDFALPSRPIDLDQVYELMPLLNEAAKLGAAIPRIVSYFKDTDRVFELQTKMKGSNIASSFDWLDATVEQIDGFIHTLEMMNKVGLYPDFIGDNVLFDQKAGFSLVDIETQPLRRGIDSAEDMGNWFIRYLNRMDWDGRDNEFEQFIDLFEYRLSLPAEQRFVNESTISQHKNSVTTNSVADTTDVDDAIGKIVQAANAIEAFVSNFGDAVNSFINKIPSEQTIYLDPYDQNGYQDAKIYDQYDASYETYNQDDSGVVRNEVESLTLLANAVNTVKEAVDAKTQAFEEEYVTVDEAVRAEVAVLTPLVEQLEKINGYLQTSFNGNGFNLNSSSLSSLQNLLDILSNITTKLQLINTGFDTLNNTTIPNVQAQPQQNVNPQPNANGGYALDTTLQGTTRLIGEINSKLGATGQLANIATALTNAATALKQIASGANPGGGGTGSGSSGSGGGKKRNTLGTDKQNLLAKDELDKQTGDASVSINKFGDETLATTQKVGTEIVKIVKTTKEGITTTAIEMSNAYKNAMEDTYKSIEGFEQAGLFGQYNQNGSQVEAQDALDDYKKTYSDLNAEIQKFETEFKAGMDTTKTQENIDRLQSKLDGLESQLIGIAKHSKAFLDSGTTFGMFTQDELNDSGNALKRLVVNSEQLAVAFRGVHEDGRKVIYDVLDNGIIKSYAIEVDEATGIIKRMELSEYGLVNAMQSVNQAAKQHKELDNILSVDGSINDQATILQNYLKKKQDLDDAVQTAWTKAQNNGGIIDSADLDIIHAMSIEVRRLGDAIQSEYNKIFKLRESGGLFEALGSTGNTTEDRMKNYMQGYAYRNSKSVSSVQYDSATKTMTADLVDLSGAITKVKIQYNELFDGVQVSSSKSTKSVDETTKKMNALKTSLAGVSGFIDQNSQEAQAYNVALSRLNRMTNDFNNGTLSFNDANIASWNQLRQTVISTGDALLTTAKNNKKADTKLNADKTKQFGSFNQYRKDIRDAAYLTDSMKSDLADLEVLLSGVSSAGDLEAWVSEFENLKKSITEAKEAYETAGGKQLNDIGNKTKSIFAQLDFKHDAQGLDAEQQAIADKYNKIQEEVKKTSEAIKKGNKVDIDAIDNELAALTVLVDKYKEKHNIENASGSDRKKAPKASQVDTARNRYKALSNRAKTDEFKDSEVIKKKLAEYTNAYNNLVNIQSEFKVGETLTQSQEDAFRQAQIECADYARELNRLFNASDKLVAQGENVRKLDVGEWENRKSVLQDYVRELYGSSAVIGDFDKNFTKLLFTIDNGDGTFTNMSAVIDDARSKIVTLTGSTKEAVSGLAGFWNDLKGKFKSIGAYLVASLSFHEVWSVIRQGVAYVKEIDSALTELKKVTDETDASYDRFLQTMSKTAGKVGSTVSELTTMAADWARLGYTMEEAGKLAESTAILLNVSEFQDANAASEALISTMQAFQYTADDSQHVVDILNEVGKLLPVDNYIG